MKRHFGHSLNSNVAAKRTLFVLACFYVMAGLAVAVSTAIAGNPLGAFLGFLIVTGTIAIAVAFNLLFHLEDSATQTQQSIDDIIRRLEQTTDSPQRAFPQSTRSKETEVSMIDLAAIGPGDPSLLAAVRLDRDMFPRLVTEMENHPPARSEVAPPDREPAPAQGDSLPEVADEPAGEALLRQEFASMIRRQDVAGALAVGRRILAIHPGRDIAKEFLRIEPMLSAKLQRTTQPEPRSRAAGNS